MAIQERTINGTGFNFPYQSIPRETITRGNWQQNKDHKFADLTECPCGYLDRFSPHGKLIREAYENAIVGWINSTWFPSLVVVVVGSGGLLQDACWLTKLFHQNKNNFTDLTLHLIDTDYTKNLNPISALAKHVESVVRERQHLTLKAWSSCASFKQARASGKESPPHLVIGMDIAHARGDAVNYQWELQGGDVEKTLFIRHSGVNGIEVYSRKGSDTTLNCKQFPFAKSKEAVTHINNAIIIG